MLKGAIFKRNFFFRFDARTSRGVMKERTSWFIKVWDEDQPGIAGIGECAPLPGLSIDDRPNFEETLFFVVANLNELNTSDPVEVLNRVPSLIPPGFSSITFGLETALLDIANGGKRHIFNNSFFQGTSIPINGLIWMGEVGFMMQQVKQKIEQGFTCIKLKVGGIHFEQECSLLSTIRSHYGEKLTIRLDANGAFSADDALDKLNKLSQFNIHSIEQPVKAGHSMMKELCAQSPIPIALDEELIGKEDGKKELLELLKPRYIILKPTLHGGLQACNEWIDIAESNNIGWWLTSALESNIGLNAICQFTANFPIQLPHGLGTGMLYENNFTSPLVVSKGTIAYHKELCWNESELDNSI